MPQMLMAHDNFAEEVCRGLGLDPGTVCDLKIHIEAVGPVQVEAVLLLTNEQGTGFVEVLKKYQLMLKELVD